MAHEVRSEMDPSLFLQADPAARALFGAILFVILLGTAFKLFAPPHWDDWLDERWGRGSVRDGWLLDRIARRPPPEQAPGADQPWRARSANRV